MNVLRISSVRVFALAAAAALVPCAVVAQEALPSLNVAPLNLALASESALPVFSSSREAALPDAPGYKTVPAQTVAPLHMKYIPAGETGQPITAHDKVIIGAKDLYSPLNFVAMLASSGYEQAVNGSPNYGTDRGAFGQRLGAAAIRETSQGVFTDMVFAPLLHEDPRYYVKGTGHSFVSRTLYAVTRPLITRTDSGRSTVNGALILGYASSAALSYTYYPSINQNFKDTASSFGGSIGGAALGYFVSEFSNDFLRSVHLKK